MYFYTIQKSENNPIFLLSGSQDEAQGQRESEKTVLYLQIIIILISYIIIKLLIIENHPSQNWKWNSLIFCF